MALKSEARKPQQGFLFFWVTKMKKVNLESWKQNWYKVLIAVDGEVVGMRYFFRLPCEEQIEEVAKELSLKYNGEVEALIFKTTDALLDKWTLGKSE